MRPLASAIHSNARASRGTSTTNRTHPLSKLDAGYCSAFRRVSLARSERRLHASSAFVHAPRSIVSRTPAGSVLLLVDALACVSPRARSTDAADDDADAAVSSSVALSERRIAPCRGAARARPRRRSTLDDVNVDVTDGLVVVVVAIARMVYTSDGE